MEPSFFHAFSVCNRLYAKISLTTIFSQHMHYSLFIFTLRKSEVKTINQEYRYHPMFSGKRQTFATILGLLAVQHNNTNC